MTAGKGIGITPKPIMPPVNRRRGSPVTPAKRSTSAAAPARRADGSIPAGKAAKGRSSTRVFRRYPLILRPLAFCGPVCHADRAIQSLAMPRPLA
jgi:hypothetical protein